MPKVVEEISEKLRPYVFHGLELDGRGEDIVVDCIFCGGSNKFSINRLTGLWRCFICGGPSPKEGGNAHGFLQWLHEKSIATTSEEDLQEVAEERRLPVSVLKEWGLVQSLIDREWLLPGYVLTRKGEPVLWNLYRWTKVKERDGSYKRRLLATPTLVHCLYGLHAFNLDRPNIFVCEGPWDAMALRLALSTTRNLDGEFKRTSNLDLSLLKDANVVAPPACKIYSDDWADYFRNTNVYLCYDSDYPKKFPVGHPKAGELQQHSDGSLIMPGYDGMVWLARKIKKVASSIVYIHWGDEGFHPDLQDGTDMRDVLTTEAVLASNA